jgi:hypothetical protein
MANAKLKSIERKSTRGLANLPHMGRVLFAAGSMTLLAPSVGFWENLHSSEEKPTSPLS